MFKYLAFIGIAILMLSLATTASATGPMYESPEDLVLFKAGVSFVRDQLTDQLFIIPGGKTGKLVPGYDKPEVVCDSLKKFPNIKKVVVYTPTERLEGSCK